MLSLLVGESVKNTWAHSKEHFQQMSQSPKQGGRDNYKQLVKDCTRPATVLAKQRIQTFASRASLYICAFRHLDQQQKQAAAEADPNSSTVAGSISPGAVIPPHKQQELLYYEIERLVKAFKGHMCALDFNNGFVRLQLKQAKVDNHYK
jgi:hypothetical protein